MDNHDARGFSSERFVAVYGLHYSHWEFGTPGHDLVSLARRLRLRLSRGSYSLFLGGGHYPSAASAFWLSRESRPLAG